MGSPERSVRIHARRQFEVEPDVSIGLRSRFGRPGSSNPTRWGHRAPPSIAAASRLPRGRRIARLRSVPPTPVKPRLDGWKFRWDVVLFFAFVLAAMRHWTDLPLHEVLGALAVPVLAVHLWLNWSWIADVLGRARETLRGEVRFNRAWDIAQSAVALVALGSGLAASRHLLPAIGVPMARHRLMEDIHSVSAWVLMVMIGVHLGVHARWIWAKVRKPRFALVVVLVTLALAGATRLEVFHRMGAFARRFKGDSIQVTAAIVPAALLAFGVLVVLRRHRRATAAHEE